MYETLRNAFKLLHERNTRRCREMSASDLRPGINRDVLFKKAPRQFALKKLCASGDATRGRRELVPLYSRLVGNVFHPDVSRWPKTYGLALPIKLADLLTVLDAIRSHNCLAHEFDTELLRCVEDDITPMLTHTIFPECHSGFSGFLHAKMWIMFNSLFHEGMLNNHGFCTDLCSTGLSASITIATPVDFMIQQGVAYLGLPDDDYNYYGAYMRPAVVVKDMEESDAKELLVKSGVDKYIPAACSMYCELPHHVRNGRRAIIRNPKKTVVMYSEKEDGIEGGIWASELYLDQLAQQRGVRGKYNLSEMLNMNSFMDQKGDAAFDLISYKTINLLKSRAPDDRGTILYLTGLNFFAHPWKTKLMTNPFAMVYFAWAGLAVFEVQERYVEKHIGRLDLHAPSYQFRECCRLQACAVINHVLNHYRDMEQFGDIQKWDCSLCRCNNDIVENVHSEERTGGMMRFTNDLSVNLAQHCLCLNRIQQVHDRRPRLEAAGVTMSRPKTTRRAHLGLITLGLPPGWSLGDISYGKHSTMQVPDSYDEFVVMLQDMRAAGYRHGLDLWRTVIPETVKQMEEKGTFLQSCHDRRKVKLPPNKAGWLASGPVEELSGMMPALVLDPDEFARNAPQRVKQQVARFEADVRADMDEDAGSEDEGGESTDTYMTPAVKAILDQAEKDRNEFQVKAAQVKEEKGAEPIFVAAESGLVAKSWEAIIAGDCVMDEDGKLYQLSQVLRAHQIRDSHSRERGKRFWVGKLRHFARAVDEQHDVCIGTCILVTWGTKAKQFAVVRVLGLLDDETKVWSMKLDKKSIKQRFQVELLDPVGQPTESKSQRYRGSGLSLPKLAATKVLSIVQLRHLLVLAEPGENVHDALLAIEDILELYEEGWHRVTKQEGYIHIESEAEKLQNLDTGVMWNANNSEYTCLQCHMSWYDDTTGVIVKCKTCQKAWHQECATPTIRLDDIDLENWECCVCTGEETEVCHRCHDFWTVDEKPREKDNNRLMFCDGPCLRLFHQNCHTAQFGFRAKYPGDGMPWHCHECQMKLDEAADEEARAEAARVASLPNLRAKRTKPGSMNNNVIHVTGMPQPGNFVVGRIADPRESNLEAATWTRGRGRGRARGRGGRAAGRAKGKGGKGRKKQ